MKDIISKPKTIVPACDVQSLAEFRKLVKATYDLPLIGGYKVGFSLGLSLGLPKVVEVVREVTDLPVIYDHQKAGSDIPDTGKLFAQTLKEAGITAGILFPQAGPVTEVAWIEALFEADLGVIVGGHMSHKGYIESDGGFIKDSAALTIYEIAARSGVREFVVPGNQPDVITRIRELVISLGVKDPVFHSPGFVAQGGSVSKMNEVAGAKWHAIVGRGIYAAKDMRLAATNLCAEIQCAEIQ